eukprot:2349217-Amphidinium_carterae.1
MQVDIQKAGTCQHIPPHSNAQDMQDSKDFNNRATKPSVSKQLSPIHRIKQGKQPFSQLFSPTL